MAKLIRTNNYTVDDSTSLIPFLLKTCSFLYVPSDIFKLCSQKRLLVNGILVVGDIPLFKGDLVELLTPQKYEPFVSEDIELLYEDDYFFMINKPSFLPVHPTGKYFFNTLSSLVERKLNLPSLYPYNRLDRETSGIVIFAKRAEFVSLLQNISIDKWYCALVFGLVESAGEISAPLLKKTVGDLRHRMVVDSKGKSALTKFNLISSNDRYSLLRIKLLTGRKHQIRVHLSHLDHPLVGDKFYGSHPELLVAYAKQISPPSDSELIEKLGATRQMLHCYKIEFVHPKTGNLVSVASEIGSDFLALLIEERISIDSL